MENDARLTLVKTIMEEFAAKGTAELLLNHLADDVKWKTTAPANTPIHERFTGPDGVREYFRRVDELLVTEEFSVEGYFQGGDKVVVLGTERLRLRRSAAESKCEWVTVFTFNGDCNRIAEVLVIEDLWFLRS